MEELGRFHASSLVFEDSLYPKTIPESFDYFEELWLDSNHPSFNVVTSMIGSLAENTANYLKSYPKYEKCVKWLNSNLQNMGTYFLGLFEIVLNKNLNVLIHGDFRATNILFRYDENNMPIDLRIVDLQQAKKASAAFDILYYFYTSLSGDVRTKNYLKLIYIYYQSFSKVLLFLKKKVPFTFKELVEDMEKRKVFGFVSGLYLIPSALARGEDSYDFADVADDKMAEYAQSQTEKFLAISRREGPFKDRFLALFDEMLESDLVKEY
ncbi:hypothetical protein Avbf_17216 [Armadillidium vulgare]|nr:hypothetical protein Avbf_17216 [Armadillidium vulgare]